MKRSPALLSACACAAAVAASAPSSPASAGAVTGTITFQGEAPATPPVKIPEAHAACGARVASQELIVDARGGLANAVVSLVVPPPARVDHSGAPKGPGGGPGVPGGVLDQKGCVFVPHVQALRKGAALEILNSDDLLHNVNAVLVERRRTLFNIAMPRKGLERSVTLKRPGVVELSCDAGHSWMRAYVHVFDHPYFAVTRADGSFRIDGVPPGTYQVSVWHEKLGTRSAEVTVGKSGAARLNLAFEAPSPGTNRARGGRGG